MNVSLIHVHRLLTLTRKIIPSLVFRWKVGCSLTLSLSYRVMILSCSFACPHTFGAFKWMILCKCCISKLHGWFPFSILNHIMSIWLHVTMTHLFGQKLCWIHSCDTFSCQDIEIPIWNVHYIPPYHSSMLLACTPPSLVLFPSQFGVREKLCSRFILVPVAEWHAVVNGLTDWLTD